MLNDIDFAEQTLNSNLYFLRTIRVFSLIIQLSLPSINEEYIDTAIDFGKRCEDLGRKLTKYADGNISQLALDDEVYVTKYTLQCEQLTEKLFGVDIDEEITKQELSFKSGSPTSISEEEMQTLMEVNQSALILITNFISFCSDIIDKLNNNEIFSYAYPSFISAMLDEANLYRINLERLVRKDSTDPTFAIDYAYLFTNLLKKLSSFIRGFADTKNQEIIVRAQSFVSEFDFLAQKYKSAVISPDEQQDLTKSTVETTDRFRLFMTDTINKLLSAKAYFIIAPSFLDNTYTTANYFKYILQIDEDK